ncbi:MAG TPA: hypothetical protein PLS70_22340 [Acidobacteriota bacterium]|nr:hypothetical protein [Acidobacteriota bacterium]
MAKFSKAGPEGSRTLVWLPSFLNRQSQKDLGLLVMLDYILMGDRLSSYVAHLSPADRSTARTILENQRSQLKQRLITILEEILCSSLNHAVGSSPTFIGEWSRNSLHPGTGRFQRHRTPAGNSGTPILVIKTSWKEAADYVGGS